MPFNITNIVLNPDRQKKLGEHELLVERLKIIFSHDTVIFSKKRIQKIKIYIE
jgi:hypothetical protein